MFRSIVKRVFQTEGLATILYEAGHSDSSVSMRTGHRDPRSLESYQNLRGGEGLRQQRDLLGDVSGSSYNSREKDYSFCKMDRNRACFNKKRTDDLTFAKTPAGKSDSHHTISVENNDTVTASNVHLGVQSTIPWNGFSGVGTMTGGTVDVTVKYFSNKPSGHGSSSS